MAEPRIRLPRSYALGDIIEVRTFIPHPMETGRREVPATGEVVPKDIIESFRAEFDGAEVFRAELSTGISANPFISFPLRTDRRGQLVCTWEDDKGRRWTAKAEVRPEP